MRKRRVHVFPKMLKFVRSVAEKTQAQTAKGANCSDTLIALIETGRRQPSYETAEAIASTLGVKLDTFALVFPADVDTSALTALLDAQINLDEDDPEEAPAA